MARDFRTAQPHKKLTDAEWDQLLTEVMTRKDVSVDRLCGAAGVSKQRFYKKFPGGERPVAIANEEAPADTGA